MNRVALCSLTPAIVLACSLASHAQTTPPAPPTSPQEVLEVAAVHLNKSGSPNTQISRRPGGHLVIVNANLRTLLRNAYGLLGFQIVDAPKWTDSDMFDVNALTASHRELTDDDMHPLLQQLLAERFQLKCHWENRDAPIYVLVPAKSGPKLQLHGGDPAHNMNTRRSPGRTQMTGTDIAMSELATNLGNQLGRYVTDETGLPGHYDFVLHFDPTNAGESEEPSLLTAMEEQLGLRLESRKGPMRVLVIDGAERPSEN